MKYLTMLLIIIYVLVVRSEYCLAQDDTNIAMNDPDKLAWILFLKVTADAKSAGNNNALFETWASDGDTFKENPTWPTTPTPLQLKPRALRLPLQQVNTNGNFSTRVLPGRNISEETRRNKPDFDFIIQNNLYKRSGLVAAFKAGIQISFPVDSLEVKANWIEVSKLNNFNGFSGNKVDAAKLYHINTAGGTQYALLSLHIISKLVPNWTWATFEHKDNPGRCDVIGCKDNFGALNSVVKPLSVVESKQHYADCVKSSALLGLIARSNIDPAFKNYCLKGSQSDFTDQTGLAVRVGNSVTEDGFVKQSSCMTCHGRAAFDITGQMTSFAGFDPISINLPLRNNAANAPVGPIKSSWYWNADGPPSLPMLEGGRDNQRIALPADFVWSIPFCAIDDTVNPPEKKSRFCSGK